jgi:hypothetical protein
MLCVQIDLVLCAVQPEADGTFGVTAVKVIDEQGLYFLSHGRSIPLTDLWRTSVEKPKSHKRTATPLRSAALCDIDRHSARLGDAL